MDIIETRRENLRRWVAEHGTPAKERSLFSQLKADGSFGERVARRLEEQYRMGAGFLDQDISDDAERQEEKAQRPVLKAVMAIEDPAADMLKLVSEMIETYRLASVTDRKRIDLAFREARNNLSASDQAKPRGR